jgi:hypothetical protein
MLPPTRITPIGLIGDRNGDRLNLAQFRISAEGRLPDLPMILSLGTSMNAGKTLASASLVRGLKKLDLRVAALKITGTGAGGDMWIVRDAGADVALDFTDAGFASTYLTPVAEIEAGTLRLLNHAAAAGCHVAVVEIADGLQQRETAELIRSKTIRDLTIGTVFAAYDSMGAICGVEVLRKAGHNLLGLSGRLGLSPLAVQEAELATGLRVFSPFELAEGALVPAIYGSALKALRQSNGGKRSVGVLAKGLRSYLPRVGATISDPLVQQATGAHGELRVLKLAQEVLLRVAEYIMERDMADLCGARFGLRSKSRVDRRNGFRRHIWQCGLGTMEIKVPRLRNSFYAPAFLRINSIGPEVMSAVLTAARGAPLENALTGLLRTLGTHTLDLADMQKLRSEAEALIFPAVQEIQPRPFNLIAHDVQSEIWQKVAAANLEGQEHDDFEVMTEEDDDIHMLAGQLPDANDATHWRASRLAGTALES